MTDPELEEVDRDILRSTLGEMQFCTGRWVGPEGLPDEIPGALGNQVSDLISAVHQLRSQMNEVHASLDDGETGETR